MKHRSIQFTKMMNCLTAAVKGFRAEFILHTKDIEAGCENTASLQSLLPFCHFFIVMTTTSTVLLNTGCSTSCYQFVLCSCLKKGVFLCVCGWFFLGGWVGVPIAPFTGKKGEGGSSFDMYYVLDFRDKKTIMLI